MINSMHCALESRRCLSFILIIRLILAVISGGDVASVTTARKQALFFSVDVHFSVLLSLFVLKTVNAFVGLHFLRRFVIILVYFSEVLETLHPYIYIYAHIN